VTANSDGYTRKIRIIRDKPMWLLKNRATQSRRTQRDSWAFGNSVWPLALEVPMSGAAGITAMAKCKIPLWALKVPIAGGGANMG
jgi:hypothetical protein